MFKKRKLKKELKSMCNFINTYGRDAIYETEIVRCWPMERAVAYIKINGNGVTAIGSDYPDKFHYID